MNDRHSTMVAAIRKLPMPVAWALLNGDLKDRELKRHLPEGLEVSDLIMAGVLFRKSNCLRLCREAIEVVASYAKGTLKE